MKICDLLDGIETKTLSGAEGRVKGISSDSRRVKKGWMFLCVRGTRHDGHHHVDEAVRNGAVFLVGEEEALLSRYGVGYAVCPNTREAEALIWNNRYGRPAAGMRTVAVTGSAGKTSTVFILRHILRRAGYRVGVVTTLGAMAEDVRLPLGENGGSSLSEGGGAMTTPDPEYFFGAVAAMKTRGCDVLLYEASSHAIHMRKTAGVCPDVALFTNLMEEHLDYHGDMETYFRVKAELFRGVGVGIVNEDDPYGTRLPLVVGETPFLRCTMRPERLAHTDVCALRYRSAGCEGVEYVYFSGPAVFRVRTPLVGRHSVYNTMLAARCAMELGVDPLTVQAALRDVPSADGRMHRVPTEAPLRVFIDYAHTEAALRSVLRCLTEIRREGERLIAVFGCGGDRDPRKRSKMGAAAQEYADLTVITGDNPRTENPVVILADILSGMGEGNPYVVIPDRETAIRYAVETAREGDIILFAGKGHEKYEIDGVEKIPFDEEKIVREAIKMRFGL